MILILDTSAFLSGMFTSLPVGYDKVFITSNVRKEVVKGAPSRILENLLEAGLKVRDPLAMETAREMAGITGDLDELSETDLSIIALSLELEDAKVITDDFRIQNVLKSNNIKFAPAGEVGERTIKEVWKWTFRCRGCGRYFDKAQKYDDCPICGSSVRKVRKR